MVQLKIFTIPPIGGEAVLEELNLFLRQERIAEVRKEFSPETGWSFCISYTDGKSGRTDSGGSSNAKEKEQARYNALNEEQRELYAKMKMARTAVSNAKGVVPYVVFSNIELMEIVSLPHIDEEAVKGLKTVRAASIKKYTADILTEYRKLLNDENSAPPF